MTTQLTLGRTVITPAALEVLHEVDVLVSLNRHANCDWGQVCQEDREANDFSLKEGLRILSVYTDRKGTTFWIITEADRSATTVLLPSDY